MPPLVDRGPAGPLRSLYVHVPYCRDRCTYCSFATVRDRPGEHAALVDGLLVELARQPPPDRWDTVHLGGGTPGLLAPTLLGRLLGGLSRATPLAPDAELTLEVNPVNVTAEALRAWDELGFTRVSLGVQTLHDRPLRQLARLHDGAQALAALDLLAERWPASWSADLLLGWHGQTAADLEADLQAVLARGPPHVSAYALTIEPGTPLHQLRSLGRPVAAPPALLEQLEELAARRLAAAGLERYEISNHARPGQRSRHNQVYWRNEGYLGLGPGASSSLHPLRWANVDDPQAWRAALADGRSARRSAERVAPADRLLESLAVGLRLAEGLATTELDRRFSTSWRPLVTGAAPEMLAAGLLRLEGGRLFVPAPHRNRTDRIVTELVRALEPGLDMPAPGRSPRSTPPDRGADPDRLSPSPTGRGPAPAHRGIDTP